MLTLLITGFFSEDDDLRRKNNYLKAVRIPVGPENRIRVYYAIVNFSFPHKKYRSLDEMVHREKLSGFNGETPWGLRQIEIY
jgi:hypothetical protein